MNKENNFMPPIDAVSNANLIMNGKPLGKIVKIIDMFPDIIKKLSRGLKSIEIDYIIDNGEDYENNNE